jgi:UPF0755 protein
MNEEAPKSEETPNPSTEPAAPPAAPPVRRNWKTVAQVLGILALVLVVAAGVTWWMLFERPAVSVPYGKHVTVKIGEGASTIQIAEQLAKAGVVTNANRFRLVLRGSSKSTLLKSGTYELTTGMDYVEAIDKLAAGPEPRSVMVTIPEGFTIRRIAARLHEKAGVSETEFIRLATTKARTFPQPFLKDNPTDSLEGYLFPKTYAVRQGQAPGEIITMMLEQFAEETTGLVGTGEAKSMNLHQLVTVASLIEREANLPKERPIVASVIYNRLQRGMRLQLDASINYLLPTGRGRLTSKDLQIESPYNLYRHRGLPPGPIANPGLAAIQAAAAPANTRYVYYMQVAQDGSHMFTDSYAAFLKAKAQFYKKVAK